MEDKALKYLSDILNNLIEEFMIGIKSFHDYEIDYKTQSAVERQLGIIGEAVNKYDALLSEKSLVNSRKIVGFRNRLIHAYDAIDSSIVWAIINNYLSPLKIEVESLL